MQEVNDAGWSRPRLVRTYANRELRPAEVMILVRHRDALAGRVLELGCGAGRITGYLLDIAQGVHAVDILPAMVEHCRRTYPAGTFALGDLRDLSGFADASFGAVVAGFNLIDVLSDEQRRGFLRSVARILGPRGLLVFSSHNRAAAPLLRTPGQVVEHDPVTSAINIVRLPRRMRNRRRLLPLERVEPDHAILNDVANDYSLLHYYIGRDAQETQLADAGFDLVECLDLDGREVRRGQTAAQCSELHYVARSIPV